MGLIGKLFSGGVEGIGNAVAGVARVFVGDKGAREAASHDQTMAVLGQFAGEFRTLQNRTWWDALIDGLNRLPRPVLALGTVGLFVYAMTDPVGFAIRMEGLNLVPDELWYLLGAIVGFFFGARELSHGRKVRADTTVQTARVKAVTENIRQLRTLRRPDTPGTAAIDDEQFRREMADTEQPLSNAAVLEWNRRRSSTGGG
ncbi:MAG: holin family protein [Minwuia sp.]|nr:holin family protein [Minwuia sp.]